MLVACCLAICALAAAPSDPAMLVGTVTDAANGAPLEDVEIAVIIDGEDPLVATTGQDGTFRVEGIPPGSRVVGVAAPDHGKSSSTIAFQPGAVVRMDRALVRVVRVAAFETVVKEVDRRSRVPIVVGSITTLSEDDLRARAPLHTGEALRAVPGVHVVDEDGTGLRQSIAFRGLSPLRSRRVLMLEDGVPIAAGPYGDPDTYYGPPVERVAGIDIAKGSDSILHGPQTIGGVLNYLTPDPPKTPTVSGEVRAGTMGYWMGHVGGGGTWGPAGVRVDITHRRAAGPRAIDLNLLDVMLKGRLAVGDHGALTLKLTMYDEVSRGVYAGLTAPQARVATNVNFSEHDRYKLRRLAMQVAHRHAFLPGLRVETTLYAHQLARDWRRQEFDRTGVSGPYERIIPPRPGAAPTTDGTSLYFQDEVTFRNRVFLVGGVEQRWFGRLNVGVTSHEVVAGARIHGERLDDDLGATTDLRADAGRTIAREVDDVGAFSAFAQYRLGLWDTLRFTPGVRFEGAVQRRNVLLVAGRAADGTTTVTETDVDTLSRVVEVMPGLGVSYSLLNSVLFYAGVHRGFAPPRTRESITPGGEDLQLGAEYSWNVETGVRLARGRWFKAEAALFHIDFQNQVINSSQADAVGGTGRPLVNEGRTRQAGMEAGATLDVAPLFGLPGEMAFTGGFTAVDSRFTASVFRGKRVPYVPAYVFAGQWRLRHPVGFSAQVNTTMVSDQFTDNDNTWTESPDGLTGPLHPYATWDGRVAYALPMGVSVYALVKNATDARYVSSRFPQGINTGGFRQLLVGVRADL